MTKFKNSNKKCHILKHYLVQIKIYVKTTHPYRRRSLQQACRYALSKAKISTATLKTGSITRLIKKYFDSNYIIAHVYLPCWLILDVNWLKIKYLAPLSNLCLVNRFSTLILFLMAHLQPFTQDSRLTEHVKSFGQLYIYILKNFLQTGRWFTELFVVNSSKEGVHIDIAQQCF
jgi:hypothetical protein